MSKILDKYNRKMQQEEKRKEQILVRSDKGKEEIIQTEKEEIIVI